MSDTRSTTSPVTYTHRVYVAGDTSRWQAAGHRVVGKSVYCTSRAEAVRIAREVVGATGVYVRTEDGTYYYRTQADADADRDTSTEAAAVVSSVEQDEGDE